MKTMKRVFSLLLFFVAAMSVQTVQAQANGDVNGDGLVNDQDIAAIVSSAREAVDVNDDNSSKTYYWYIGQTNPAEMTEIAPIIKKEDDVADAEGFCAPGWREIGTSIPEYGASNMLWNGEATGIRFENRDYYYIALPCNSIGIWYGLTSDGLTEHNSLKSITIDNVKYFIYKSKKKYRAFACKIY